MILKDSLARQTINDYLTVLKKVFESGCDQYDFQIRDPFVDIEQFIPKGPKVIFGEGIAPNIPVWRFDGAMKIIEHMIPQYRNVTRLMFLTGLSASEIAGIKKQSVTDKHLYITEFITRRSDPSEHGKSKYRSRVIKLTRAIRECLEEAMETAQDDYLFRSATGKHFSCSIYADKWSTSVNRAGVPYKRPYSTRHTFAAWAYAVGMIPNQLVKIMGHGSKKMIYEIYGEWHENLEEDVEKIRQFFGEDFGK
jgi:integrase